MCQNSSIMHVFDEKNPWISVFGFPYFPVLPATNAKNKFTSSFPQVTDSKKIAFGPSTLEDKQLFNCQRTVGWNTSQSKQTIGINCLYIIPYQIESAWVWNLFCPHKQNEQLSPKVAESHCTPQRTCVWTQTPQNAVRTRVFRPWQSNFMGQPGTTSDPTLCTNHVQVLYFCTLVSS